VLSRLLAAFISPAPPTFIPHFAHSLKPHPEDHRHSLPPADRPRSSHASCLERFPSLLAAPTIRSGQSSLAANQFIASIPARTTIRQTFPLPTKVSPTRSRPEYKSLRRREKKVGPGVSWTDNGKAICTVGTSRSLPRSFDARCKLELPASVTVRCDSRSSKIAFQRACGRCVID
jgi:hypothetical protein